MLQDFRLAIRRLRNAPGFTAVAVVTLALAIGANTAIFTVADTVLYKPLPYADPEHVYVLATLDTRTGERSRSVDAAYLRAIDEQHRGLSEVGIRGPTSMTIHADAAASEWMETFAVAPEYFRVLGVQAAKGRLFDTQDLDAPGRTAVLTHEAWQRRFGGDETIVGRAVRLGRETREVIGVLPAGFIFPTTSLRFLYNPTGRPEYLTATAPSWRKAGQQLPFRALDESVVRLERGVTRDQAQAEIDAIVRPLRGGREERVVLESPRAVLFPAGRPMLAFLVTAAGLVLLLGCVNLTTMLLARTRHRQRELGLHAALGATRLRIVRPIVFETLLIAMAAAGLALAVTAITFDVLLRQVPPVAYGNAPIHFGVRVAIFAVAIGVAAGLAFAVLPAWRSSRLDVQALVRDTRAAARLRGPIFGQPAIAAQVTLAIVLVCGAVVAARAFVAVLRVPLGFSPENLIAINVRPDGPGAPELRAFYPRVIEALSNRPDVAAAGAGTSVPTDGFGGVDVIESPNGQAHVDVLSALPGYFETIGLRPVQGRLLTPADADGDAAVLSMSAVRALVQDRGPIGATVRTRQGRQLTVAGVVPDMQRSLSRRMAPVAYAFPSRTSTRGLTIVARVRARTASAPADLQRAIGALAAGAPVTTVWWSDAIDAQAAYRNPRFQLLVLGTFAGLALVLTSLGVFAAIAFSVAARTREMGVRLALGAPAQSLVRLVMRQSAAPVAIGLAGGVLAAYWLRRIAEAQLFDVDTHDPLTLAIATVTVACIALVAAYLPARHVTRVDPMRVLRAE